MFRFNVLESAAITYHRQQDTHLGRIFENFHLPAIGSTTTRLWVSGAGMVALLVWLAVATLPDGRLYVAFLDVGQLRQY